jgi:Glycosyl transferase family 2
MRGPHFPPHSRWTALRKARASATSPTWYILAALDMAIKRRQPAPGLIHHRSRHIVPQRRCEASGIQMRSATIRGPTEQPPARWVPRDCGPPSVDRPAPVVTVITPTFNHAPFIGRCLSSVLEQTECRWEQIVIDDGSTDGTAEIVRHVADGRIRYVHRHHRGIRGLGDAYNLALGMARGELIAVLEGDDFWPPDKLERQLPAFRNPQIVLSWGQAAETDADGVPLRLFPDAGLLLRLQNRSVSEAAKALLEVNCIPACTVICRRSALLAVGGFQQPDGLPNVDYPTWLELCRVGRFAPVNHLLGYYRRHGGQVSVVMRREMLRNLRMRTTFVERLPPSERQALGVSLEQARRFERRRRAGVEFASGRAALMGGRHAVAASHFRQAFRAGDSPTRARAILGLSAVYLRLDLERMATVRQQILSRRDRRLLDSAIGASTKRT